jgi:hypothetical protein
MVVKAAAVNFIIRTLSTSQTPVKPEVLLTIGNNVERLIKETTHFLNQRHTADLSGNLLHPKVRLVIQPGDDVKKSLLVVGDRSYKRAFFTLRWMLWMWYFWRYRHLQIHAFPEANETEGTIVRLRWNIEGQARAWWPPYRPSYNSPSHLNRLPLLSGYSTFQFDQSNGSLLVHRIDRLIPPMRRTAALVRLYLERLKVGTSGGTPQPVTSADVPSHG